jgi:uncharacterized protein YdeI (YjbR/CyaY-like superfamily)
VSTASKAEGLNVMALNSANPKADWFFCNAQLWQEEFKKLRSIILNCSLNEELKWGKPCYTYMGNNIVLIHGFKEYCALLFFKGALLKDRKGILIQQTKNVQAARQIRFTGVKDIIEVKKILKAYIEEAIEAEESGLKVEFKTTREFAVPAELKIRIDDNSDLRTAFASLTPGRQRAYLLHFSAAKQSKTREARVEKCIPQILDGLGLDD